MGHRTLSLLVIALLASLDVRADVSVSAQAAPARLSAAEQAVLTEMIEAHRRVQWRLSEADRSLMDSLIAVVKPRLFGAPLRDDLLTAVTQVVSQVIPELTPYESAILGEYVLGGIASDTSVAPTLMDLQARFDGMYLRLQTAMQHENQVFTSVSNVLKTRHDTAKNSIGNIR